VNRAFGLEPGALIWCLNYKKNMMNKTKQQRGFTLIELMVTVAVAIIVLAVGIPAYDSMMANNRAIAQSNMFRAALNLARAEALGRNTPVTLIAMGADWTSGWSVYVEDGYTGLGTKGSEADEPTVKVWDALEPGTVISTNIDSSGSASALAALTFTGNGELLGGNDANFEFSQTGSTGIQMRCFCINSIGRISSFKASEDVCEDNCPVD
jgi:type IV fimbrial biogenesis protein FimT